MGGFIRMLRGGGRHFHRGGRGTSGGRGRGRFRGGRGRHFRRGGIGTGVTRDYDITNDEIEILGEPSEKTLNIAIEGCCHGEIERIYDRLQAHEKQTGMKVDLLICCGDFQSFRNPADFHSCSMPPKYRRLGSFPKYYSGEKQAPILTLFIGGNHEASQPLRELYYGGWAAPNMYYLGAAGVVQYAGIRIGGISNIFKSHDYKMGHFEHPPFDNSTLRSVYHVRNVDIFRMKCLSKRSSRVDIIASHDWPLGIEQHGNTEDLLRRKPFFREEVKRNDLGSPPNREVLDTVKPRWWFSAHLHVKFSAKVDHRTDWQAAERRESTLLIPSQVQTKGTLISTECGDKAVDENQTTQAETEPARNHEDSNVGTKEVTRFHGLESSCSTNLDLTQLMTKFLALDKCLPRRHYLSILHVDCEEERKRNAKLEFDPEWLAILRKTHHMNCTERKRVEVPDELAEISDEDLEWVRNRLKAVNCSNPDLEYLAIPTDFVPTVPFHSDSLFQGNFRCPPFPMMGNPQTDFLLDLLELEHSLTVPTDSSLTPDVLADSLKPRRFRAQPTAPDENEIEIEIDENSPAEDENEIDIEDGSDDEDEAANANDESKLQNEESALAKRPRLDE